MKIKTPGDAPTMPDPAAVPDHLVPETLGKIERIRAALYRRLGHAPTDAVAAGMEGTPDRFLRVDEVIARTGIGRTTIWRMERDGEFPQRRQVGSNSVAWLESEVSQWISSRPTAEATD